VSSGGLGVLVCVAAALYAGLGLGIAVETAENELDFVLDFVELGVCLMIVSLSANREDAEEWSHFVCIYRSRQN